MQQATGGWLASHLKASGAYSISRSAQRPARAASGLSSVLTAPASLSPLEPLSDFPQRQRRLLQPRVSCPSGPDLDRSAVWDRTIDLLDVAIGDCDASVSPIH